MASSSTSGPPCSPELIALGESPHQPKEYSFPKRSFGKKVVFYSSFNLVDLPVGNGYTIVEAKDYTLSFLYLKAKENGVVVTYF